MRYLKLTFFLVSIYLYQNTTGQISSNDFVTTWYANDSTVFIPISTSYQYNYDVDWNNDGVFDDLGVTSSISHSYNFDGPYVIRIRGTFPAIKFGNSISKDKIGRINQWGNILIKDFSYAFANCFNIELFASQSPNFDNLSSVSCERAFYRCGIDPFSNFNWNTSSITNMKGMFEESPTNIPMIDIQQWNVSSVTDMSNMFRDCSGLDYGLNYWDVSSVTNMSRMFQGVPLPSTMDLSSWDVSSVTDMSYMFNNVSPQSFPFYTVNIIVDSWDVSSVTNMESMFSSNFAVSGLDVASWNVSSVTNMRNMFNLVSLGGHLGNWNIGLVTDMTDMLNSSGLSSLEYDSTLIGWAQQTHQMNVKLGALNLEYCISTNARNQLLNDGWVITGDTSTCITSINEIKSNNIKVYPNPTSGFLQVKNINYTELIEIYSVEGKLLKREKLVNSSLDLNFLKDGLYFIKIGGNSMKKINLIKR